MANQDRFAAAWAEGLDRHKGERIGTIWAKRRSGTGDATLTVDFLDADALLRADILQDVIGVLQREYELAVASITHG